MQTWICRSVIPVPCNIGLMHQIRRQMMATPASGPGAIRRAIAAPHRVTKEASQPVGYAPSREGIVKRLSGRFFVRVCTHAVEPDFQLTS